MIDLLALFFHVLVSPFKTQARLEAEIIMLRHQLNVLRRRVPAKPKLTVADRLLFVWLYRLFPSVLRAVTIVQPDTVVRWPYGQKFSQRSRITHPLDSTRPPTIWR